MTKNFKLLFLSQIFSQVTVQMMNFLLLARLYIVTGSTIATSLLWVSYALPSIFFGPIGASLVDLVSRRKVLMFTNFFQSLIIFLFIFSHHYSIFLLFVVVLSYSFLNQFYVPAENASLPSLVSKSKLAKANSMFFLTQQVALVVGFGFAGVIENIFRFEGALLICSGLLFIAFLSVTFLPKMQPQKKLPENFEKILKIFLNHILEGYQFIRSKKYILYPLGLLFFIQVGLSIVITNLPIIAEQILFISISYVGLWVVVPAGIGAVFGSIMITKLLKKGWRKKRIIDISLAILSLSMIGLVLGYVFMASFFVFFIGLSFVGVNIPTITYLQEVTPKWLRGRVFGNLWFFISIATIFPIIFSGIISEFFGVKTLLTVMSLSVIVIFVYSYKKGQKIIDDNF